MSQSGATKLVGDCPYHRPEMRITYLFLPLYFGLFAGLVGHSVRVGLGGRSRRIDTRGVAVGRRQSARARRRDGGD